MTLLRMDDAEALIMVALVTDALGALMVDHEGEIPLEVNRGAILLADELLRRVWPLLDLDRVAFETLDLRRRVSAAASSVRRDYRLVGIQ